MGPKGEPGERGPPGEKGERGEKGKRGKRVSQVLFLNSIHMYALMFYLLIREIFLQPTVVVVL